MCVLTLRGEIFQSICIWLGFGQTENEKINAHTPCWLCVWFMAVNVCCGRVCNHFIFVEPGKTQKLIFLSLFSSLFFKFLFCSQTTKKKKPVAVEQWIELCATHQHDVDIGTLFVQKMMNKHSISIKAVQNRKHFVQWNYNNCEENRKIRKLWTFRIENYEILTKAKAEEKRKAKKTNKKIRKE